MPRKSYKSKLIEQLKQIEVELYRIEEGYNESMQMDLCNYIETHSNKCLCNFEGFKRGNIGCKRGTTCLLRYGKTADTLIDILKTDDTCYTLEEIMYSRGYEFIHAIIKAIEQTPREHITIRYLRNEGLPRRISKVIRDWKLD